MASIVALTNIIARYLRISTKVKKAGFYKRRLSSFLFYTSFMFTGSHNTYFFSK